MRPPASTDSGEQQRYERGGLWEGRTSIARLKRNANVPAEGVTPTFTPRGWQRRTWLSVDVYPRQFITGHKGMCSFGHAAEQQNKRDTQIEEARWGAHGHGPGEALKSRPGEAQTNTTIR